MIPKHSKVSLCEFINEVLDEVFKDETFKKVKQECDEKKVKEIFEKCLTNDAKYDIMVEQRLRNGDMSEISRRGSPKNC